MVVSCFTRDPQAASLVLEAAGWNESGIGLKPTALATALVRVSGDATLISPNRNWIFGSVRFEPLKNGACVSVPSELNPSQD